MQQTAAAICDIPRADFVDGLTYSRVMSALCAWDGELHPLLERHRTGRDVFLHARRERRRQLAPRAEAIDTAI